MDAFFHISNFYVDLISVIIIVMIFIAMIIGLARGFLYQLVGLCKLVLTLLAAIFFFQYLGDFLYNVGLGDTFNNAYTGFCHQFDGSSVIVTAENREALMQACADNLKIPGMVQPTFFKILNPFIPVEGGDTIGNYLTIGLSHITLNIIAFSAIIIVGLIIFTIIGHFVKKARKEHVLGGTDKVLGMILAAVMCYILIDAILLGISSLMMVSNNFIGEWFTKTMYLSEDNAQIFTISKFIYNNNLTRYLLSLVLK